MTILLLKLVALIATGVFAILGMWAEHRETKKLAKSFPFWGVVLTTLLSGLLLFIETNKAAQKMWARTNRGHTEGLPLRLP